MFVSMGMCAYQRTPCKKGLQVGQATNLQLETK